MRRTERGRVMHRHVLTHCRRMPRQLVPSSADHYGNTITATAVTVIRTLNVSIATAVTVIRTLNVSIATAITIIIIRTLIAACHHSSQARAARKSNAVCVDEHACLCVCVRARMRAHVCTPVQIRASAGH